ncbi:MAG TPA: hypothetical protein PKN80_02865 [bacterium]|nr:hypothetical protein [bacterium]HNS49342.1 hypothetical protein [bacterium]
MELIFAPTMDMLKRFWYGLSNFVLVLVFFLIGWLIAKIITLLLIHAFRTMKIDRIMEESGFKSLLEKGGVKRPASEMVANLIYWVLLLVVVFLALSIGGIAIPTNIIGTLLAFIPKLLLGIVIFVFAMFVGKILRGVVKTSAANSGVDKADTLAKIAEIAVLIFGAVLSMQVVGIAAEFIGTAFNIVLASICFGAALAFALGSKDLIREWLEGFKKKS